MRELHGHKVNPANDTLTISVFDEPGAGGACHAYHIAGADLKANPSGHHTTPGAEYGTSILFQNGPINDHGVNGVTHEALIAIVIDRMESFQAGQFACPENEIALGALKLAQRSLLLRTELRMKRGVEGTHAK